MAQSCCTKIYALVDKETLLQKGVSLLSHLEHLKNFDIPILQYRNKNGTLEEKESDLILIREYYAGVLIVNDAIELIDLADGLHIGQEDIREYDEDLFKAVAKIRQKIGTKQLGLSTHNQAEIEEANTLDLDYIGLGAYRATKTKSEANVGGKELLAAAKLSRHPVGIIGGVKIEDEFEEPIIYKVIGSDLYL
ncbi:thiamine phosphate synthase [Sulfurovum sp. zt1-1]|uniref:Thiamine phosphate synthase n=1 Tax=Sulfurovum zhangzhouensis TaxID=3019067 RepID=A0ABT7QYR9_9BACT|nr:thiamine phosphate synthase [Sulfurovum zhangzhouensis]MDM5271942.1 thiamine phosphate synthase [Sulfurovum zhangzhouensis]